MSSQDIKEQGAIWQAVDIICDTPILLILQSLWLGINRFDALHEATGLTKTVISNRLKKLIAADIITRRAYKTRPLRHEYVFKYKGLALFETALLMYQWESKWNPDGTSKTFKLLHRTCGEYVTPICACQTCSEDVITRDIHFKLTKDLSAYPSSYVKRRRQAGSVALQKEKPVIFQEIAEIFGDRWCALIVRAAFFGVRRYDGFLKATNASTNILADRLHWLVQKGIFKKKEYQQNPPRFEYNLTAKGLDILPILLFWIKWINTVFAPGSESDAELTHTLCNAPLVVKPKCSHCHEELKLTEIRVIT
jgi:DNA-binding HxlR family transcriptional regulator